MAKLGEYQRTTAEDRAYQRGYNAGYARGQASVAKSPDPSATRITELEARVRELEEALGCLKDALDYTLLPVDQDVMGALLDARTALQKR